ncbi:hypothetical protein BDW68DRAFT_164301 [Aspergillus falconensis]
MTMSMMSSLLPGQASLTTSAYSNSPSSGSGFICLAPSKKNPQKADLNRVFTIGWRLMDGNGAIHGLGQVVVIADGQKLKRTEEPLSQPMPLVLSEEAALTAMRESPTMGSVWVFFGQVLIDNGGKVINHGEMFLAFALDYAYPEESLYFKKFFRTDNWDKTAAWLRTPEILRTQSLRTLRKRKEMGSKDSAERGAPGCA